MLNSGNNYPLITVLIAVKNESRFICDTLSALLKQNYPKDKLEIIVIDGMSNDDTLVKTQRFTKEFQHFKILKNTSMLAASSWNLGLRHATGEIISILSGHAILHKDYYRLVAQHLTYEVAGVGGRALPIGFNKRSEQIAKAFRTKLGSGGATYIRGEERKYAETISFGSYWKKDLESIEGFDESIVRGQDWDLNMRLRRAGFKLLFVPEIEAEYVVRDSLTGLWKRQYFAGLWKFFINKKSKKMVLMRHLVPGGFALILILLLLMSLFFTPTRYLLAFVLVLYLLVVTIENIINKVKLIDYPVMYCIYFIIHFAYGLGLILGINKK